MDFDVLTLFPDMIEPIKNFSIIRRAVEKGLININVCNFRDYSQDAHNKVDDYPYGGGSGLLIQAQPLSDAIEDLIRQDSRVVYMSPAGKVLDQKSVNEFSLEKHIIIVCGHYEGIDQRIIDKYVDDEISIGDYVLSGGEIPAMVFMDSIIRLVDGVIKRESFLNESHYGKFLEHPQYTRPEIYKGMSVPNILLSGDHKKIEKYRLKESIRKTFMNRPDLVDLKILNDEEKRILEEIKTENDKEENNGLH